LNSFFDLNNFFELATVIFASYFMLANGIFFSLLLVSFFSVRKVVRSNPMVESLKDRYALIAPAVSVIAPAYNEEKTVVESIHSFLRLDYPSFEILLVNDGSKDSTLQQLQNNFDLIPAERFYDNRLSTSKVRGFYRSKTYPNLFVVDKENGGKADAINVGLGFAQNTLFCAVDSDSILEPDCLLRVVVPFIEEPETTIAAGGTVRPVNGCVIEQGRVTELRFPRGILGKIQIVEYLRAFLFGRQGWNAWNSTLIISGAFGIFKKDIVIEAGGYRRDSIGEDMELVVRLRRYAVENELPYRISFVPDPICWTEVPETVSGLALQRDRWQRGLADSLFSHMRIFLNPRYGAAGLLAFPYFLLVELFGPIIETAAYIFIGVGLYLGKIDHSILLLFILVDIVFGIFMSFGAVFIEESAFHKYTKLSHLIGLVILSFIEQLGFRQLLTILRLRGLINYVLGRKSWGSLSRTGFDSK